MCGGMLSGCVGVSMIAAACSGVMMTMHLSGTDTTHMKEGIWYHAELYKVAL